MTCLRRLLVLAAILALALSNSRKDEALAREGEGKFVAPTYSLRVNGKDNCILLDNSVAVRADVPAGTYTVHVGGNAYVDAAASYGKVLIRYAGADGADHLEALPIGGSRILHLRNGYGFYAFFADSSDRSDKGGMVTLSLGSELLQVNGRVNCILLADSVAARTNLPAGTYTVKVTGDAFYATAASHGKVLVRYAGADGTEHLDALPIGSTTTLNLRNGYGFYAFFADWSSVSDNSGVVTIEFYKQLGTEFVDGDLPSRMWVAGWASLR